MSGRILLTATGSGCGKTTITIGLLKALIDLGFNPASFKCGPDYIDPMYHRKVLEIPSYNLDPFFCDKNGLASVLGKGLKGKDIGVIEGVMGFYDGYGDEGLASTCDVAISTDTPVILIVNAKGIGQSAGAILKGFITYKEKNNIRGVIFNNTTSGMYPLYAKQAEKLGLVPLGFMPYCKEAELKSRHLGLLTADEVKCAKEKIEILGKLAKENLDIDAIIKLAEKAVGIEAKGEKRPASAADGEGCKLAVARDEAFSFIYQDNIDILEELGCKIAYFSPVADKRLPEGINGLYIPGGYPELYAKTLSQNLNMRKAINEAVKSGMPTIAECGGFMYLGEALEGWPMAGVRKGASSKKDRLVRFGYGTMEAKKDGLILKKGESIRIHEFHYFDSDNNGEDFEVTKASNGSKYLCAFQTDTLYAGYPHLYFRANVKVAENFVAAMRNYGIR